MNRELILSSGAVNVYLALHLWSSDALECVGLVSCAGTLYDLEHHQDCSGHHTSLWSCPLASHGYGEGCGNIPGCGLHVRSVFCLALSINSRNAKFLY